jgi:prepilin-type N-terminal cleavage/methylation domain-containing protein
MSRTIPGGMGRAFTLIELLIVIAIVGILTALVTFSLDGVIDSARVQRSAGGFVQATVIAKQYALTDLRAYHLTMNSCRQDHPDLRPDIGIWGDAVSLWAGGRSVHGNTLQGDFRPAPLWSDRPEDQWYAVMGPWLDADGRWSQARGGPFRVASAEGLPVWKPWKHDDPAEIVGGVFGPTPVYNAAGKPCFPVPPNSLQSGGFPGGKLRVPSDWRTSWIWDPLGVQVGPRRFLERGTRWMARFDCPEWVTADTNDLKWVPCNQQANFVRVLWPPVSAGQSAGWEQTVTGFNFYPSGGIDRNRCGNPVSFLPSGESFTGGNIAAYVGIVGAKKRSAQYTTPTGTTVTYARPVNQLFITLKKNGDILTGRSPILRN